MLLHILDARGIETAPDASEPDVAMDTSSVYTEESDTESAVKPQVS